VILDSTPLRSRFGRRLLLLFVGCALIPIALVAAVSYLHVSQQLHVQTETRLHQADKALGLAIFERLLLLDATLKSIPTHAILQLELPRKKAVVPSRPQPPKPGNRTQASGGIAPPVSETRRRAQTGRDDLEAGRTLVVGLDLLARRRFIGLEFVSPAGKRVPIFGRLQSLPEVSDTDRANLQVGLPVIFSRHQPDSNAHIFLLRQVDRLGVELGTLVGEISPDFLWGTLDLSMPSQTTLVTVADDSGHVLFRSSTASEASRDELLSILRPDTSDAGAGDRGTRAYVSSTWPIVLDEVFAAPTWTLILSQPEDEVIGPMVQFTKPFLGVVLFCGLAVILLSFRQIRRSLLPLEELQQGTRRIAQRDFASRVTVTSGDEFEELGSSFNAMAMQLGRQFQALATAAEIDRAVLSATHASEIVETVLARVRDIFPCRMVSVTLVAPEGAKSLPSLVHDYGSDLRRQVRVDLRSPDVHELLDGPDVAVLARREDPPSYLVPLAEARSVVVLPLRFQRQLLGVIALGEMDSGTHLEEELVQIRRVADQAAIALANARMLEQVRTLAYYDSLTGLPNRLTYKERLARALEHASREGKMVAAFFIDLDHFSRINDTLGHEAGDRLLQQVAARLRASCRERDDEVGPVTDSLAPDVARLGGDEFTILMAGLTDPQDAAKLARRVLSSLAHPMRLDGRDIFVNASIGIAIYPYDGEDIETLLMHADTAMYKAKEQGGSSYQCYSRSMNATAMQRLTLEHALRRALEREEFEIHYQPIVHARTGVIVGAEALVRWRHPELGLLLPSEFVALAEENGLIVPLGEWVLQGACAQNREWQAQGLSPIRVVVNLSSRQLTRGLTDTVSRILQSTSLEPRFLGLELTESVLVNHQKEGTDTLHALRSMGLHLSVDDFGTGYSSFSYLKAFPLDTLKIDRCFVRGIASDPDDAAITTAMIAMGHALGLEVVAEGVETEAQMALLRKQGCDEMQGYLFSRPVPAAGLRPFLMGKRPVIRPASRRTRWTGPSV
jgi:diguanylate cyclase (GGDEF)-like protein